MNFGMANGLVTRFGRKFKKRFIQQANRRSQMKGTVGSFNRYCRSKGLAKNGKVTRKCINRAKRSKSVTLRRRAIFAQNIKAFAGAKCSRFGTSSRFAGTLQRFGKAKTLNKSKYFGRKSPGVSATLFPVGTVKKGLDKKMWVIVQTSKGVKRWKRMSSSFGTRFGKAKTLNKKKEPLRIEENPDFIHNIRTSFGKRYRKVKTRNLMFGEDIYKNNGDPEGFVKTILERQKQQEKQRKLKEQDKFDEFDDFDDFEEQEKIEHDKQIIIKKLEKEIDLAEKIIIKYPENNTLRARAVRKLTSAKNYLGRLLTKKNVIGFMRDSMEIVNSFVSLLNTFTNMSNAYSNVRKTSKLFVGLLRPIEKLLDNFRSEHVDDSHRYTWVPKADGTYVKVDTRVNPEFHRNNMDPEQRRAYDRWAGAGGASSNGYRYTGGARGYSSGLGWGEEY